MVIHHACTYSPPFLNAFLKLINYFLSTKLSSVICVSKATRESVFYKSSLFDNQILQNLVIYNGVKKKLNYPQKKSREKIKIGLVSRIEKYKGHEDLISALKLLPKSYLDKLEFHLVGGGNKEDIINLREIIEKSGFKNTIFLRGYVDKKIDDIIIEFDLTMSLTRSFEGFGLSIAESIVSEVPVIVTDVGAIREYLNNDLCEIIDPSSPQQIRDGLIKFCDNREIWGLRAKKAKTYLEENFNSEIMATNYLNHLTEKVHNET